MSEMIYKKDILALIEASDIVEHFETEALIKVMSADDVIKCLLNKVGANFILSELDDDDIIAYVNTNEYVLESIEK